MHLVSLYLFSSRKQANGDDRMQREYSSSLQRYSEEIGLLMLVLQPGLRLFPTSRKSVGKMNIFETDTVATQKVFLK